MPYVYHAAKSEAVTPVRSENIGTALARMNAIAVAAKHKRVHVNQPPTVCE